MVLELLRMEKKEFCMFVDFEKAFDNVSEKNCGLSFYLTILMAKCTTLL